MPTLAPPSTIFLAVLGLIAACGGDDGDGGSDQSADTATLATGSTGTSPSSSGGMTPTTAVTGDSGGASSGGQSASSEGADEDTAGSTGPVNTCDPVVPGEWNACIDKNGTVDTTLCNWSGLPGTTGFIGCLTAPEMAGNSCMITGCEDACDCFAPPATGTAVVTCAEILKGGGTACVLSCANGETCPDGSECLGGSCHHPS